ncbi:MAG: glutamine synthetase family protein [Planctomycetes bacterium]|nr:glutamine synthetase family protein [Planctomycetota bacterium]
MPTGRLTLEELAPLVENGEIETVLAVFPDWYGRLVGKRATGRFFLDSIAGHGLHACDYLLACDMEMDPVPGYAFASWEAGYGDVKATPDLSTLRRAAWLPKTALVLCDLSKEPGDRPVEVAPRRILARQMERARGLDFLPQGGSEIEVYLFRDSYDAARAKDWHDLEPFGSYVEDYHILQGTKEEPLVGAIVRGLEGSAVPVESSKGEWGPGQQEINLEYSPLLEQADRNVLYKHAAKEIAHSLGFSVTFMAKWNERLAGSSMHQHVSLWDLSADRNLFAGGKALGPVHGSELFRWFLGGWMAHAAELSAFYAPNVNSYKRYQAGSFAPTAIAWSHDNRTAGFRVVGEGKSLRIECRIPGADANPYLAYAASLAAGLKGIAEKIEPPPIFRGDVYAAKALPQVPKTLREAIASLEKSAFAREAFGEEVHAHYLHFLRTEQRKFDEVVTCWERARFFERG